MTVRILVTVSRSWTSWSTMRSTLGQAHESYPGAVLVHGDAERGDRQAAGMWRSMGGVDEPWPAKWREHGVDCRCPRTTRSKTTCRFAGFRRNIAMVETGPDLCLAFIKNNSAGASHCSKLAIDAGIPTLIYRPGAVEPELYNVDAAVGAP